MTDIDRLTHEARKNTVLNKNMVAHLMVDLSDLDLDAAPVFQKSATVQARPSIFGERLVTTLADGTVETARELGIGQMVITQQSGSQYAIPAELFHSRWTWNGTEYESTGQIRAVRNPWGERIVIDAPWGERQFGGADCWVAVRLDDGKVSDNRYLIGAGEFADTYKEA